jgi:hypothetical protein
VEEGPTKKRARALGLGKFHRGTWEPGFGVGGLVKVWVLEQLGCLSGVVRCHDSVKSDWCV